MGDAENTKLGNYKTSAQNHVILGEETTISLNLYKVLALNVVKIYWKIKTFLIECRNTKVVGKLSEVTPNSQSEIKKTEP